MHISGYEMRAVNEPLVLSTRVHVGLEEGQALVKVVGCGVCHTDLGFLYQGVPTRHALPLVLGHEVAGVVVEEGPGVSGLMGKKVIIPAVIPCGQCDVCQRGLGEICPKQIFPGNDVHGGFATHLAVPAHGLCSVPDSVDDATLAQLSVCADAVSTAYQAIIKSHVGEGDFAIFVGVGGVGGFGAQIAATRGAKVLAIDVDQGRLEQLQNHGVDWILNATEHDARGLKKAVRGLAKEAGLKRTEWKIFETSGTSAGQETAFNLLTFGATLAVVGYNPGKVNLRISNLMAFSAKAVGTWGCLPEHFPAVMDLVLSSKIALEPFIQTFPMDQINAVFEQLKAHTLTKRPVLLPNFE